eukprot:126929-Chlamydomonas_euryale.AAC.1
MPGRHGRVSGGGGARCGIEEGGSRVMSVFGMLRGPPGVGDLTLLTICRRQVCADVARRCCELVALPAYAPVTCLPQHAL